MTYYKARRSKEERSTIYKALRECEIPSRLAHRFRDCSRGHCRTLVATMNHGGKVRLFNKLIKGVKI